MPAAERVRERNRRMVKRRQESDFPVRVTFITASLLARTFLKSERDWGLPATHNKAREKKSFLTRELRKRVTG